MKFDTNENISKLSANLWDVCMGSQGSASPSLVVVLFSEEMLDHLVALLSFEWQSVRDSAANASAAAVG